MLVRTCEATYDDQAIQDEGIQVGEAPFKEKSVPTADVIADWLSKVEKYFDGGNVKGKRIAIHCENGIDHSPFLLALVLLDKGWPPKDTIKAVQMQFRGSIDFQ